MTLPFRLSPTRLGTSSRDRSRGLGDDMGLPVVEKNSQHIGSWHSADAAVAEVQTEEIDVRGMLVLVEGFEPPLYRF